MTSRNSREKESEPWGRNLEPSPCGKVRDSSERLRLEGGDSSPVCDWRSGRVRAKRSRLAGTPLKHLGVLALTLALSRRERGPSRFNSTTSPGGEGLHASPSGLTAHKYQSATFGKLLSARFFAKPSALTLTLSRRAMPLPSKARSEHLDLPLPLGEGRGEGLERPTFATKLLKHLTLWPSP